MLVAQQALLTKILAQLIEHAVAGPYSGALDGVFIGLSKPPTGTLTSNSPFTAITEANYDGYARQPIVWRAPYVEIGGAISLQSAQTYWTPTDTLIQNTINGMFVADALTAGNLLASEIFAVPQPLAGPQNAFSLALIFALGANNNYGGSVIIN